MNGQRRVIGLVLAGMFACASGGCSGKQITYEDMKKIKPGVSLAEAEATLGAGSASSEEDIAKANQGPGPGVGLTYRTWKDSKSLLVIGFQNDRMNRSFFTTTDNELNEKLRKDREAQQPQRSVPGVPEAVVTPQPETPGLNDPMMFHKMAIVAGQLHSYAVGHQDRLPANVGELEKWNGWSVLPSDVQQGIRSGQYVVVWGAKIDRFDGSKVIAWPKGALEKGGYVAKSGGTADELTAADIKANMAKP